VWTASSIISILLCKPIICTVKEWRKALRTWCVQPFYLSFCFQFQYTVEWFQRGTLKCSKPKIAASWCKPCDVNKSNTDVVEFVIDCDCSAGSSKWRSMRKLLWKTETSLCLSGSNGREYNKSLSVVHCVHIKPNYGVEHQDFKVASCKCNNITYFNNFNSCNLRIYVP